MTESLSRNKTMTYMLKNVLHNLSVCISTFDTRSCFILNWKSYLHIKMYLLFLSQPNLFKESFSFTEIFCPSF